MSEFFAEATVTIRPNLAGFVKELRAELKAKITEVETARPPKIRIGPALTKNFVGDLRRQVNAAVAQAQRGVRPIQVRAVLSDVSRRQIERELRSRTQTVSSVPIRQAAAVSTRAAASAAVPIQQSAAAQRVLNTAIAQGIPLLGQQVAATTKATKAQKANQQQIVQAVPAARKLAAAQTAIIAAQLAPAGSAAQIQQARIAQGALLTAQALAKQATTQHAANVAVAQAAPALQTQITALQNANAQLTANQTALRQQAAAVTNAARQQEAAASRSARGQEQLRRGALSTSLSFLGIRGATLAASASFLAGAAAIAVFAKALQSASQFADNLNVFRATTAATAEELERVSDAARALGADIRLPGVTAADAAESMLELAKAGLGVQDSIEGARGVLLLATAAAIENAQAVELAANALNAFQLQGRDATRVADVFANAANAAQGSIVDIGIAFQQAAAAGRQVGLSFEDTAAFLTILAQNGLKGSDAGTSLRTALIRLIKPTDEAKAKLKQLGVEIRDANGNLRPDIFIQLTEAVKDLSPAARDAVIALVGGQDAFRALAILGRQSIEDFIKLRRELRQQGTAAEIAAARNEGLRGSLDALGSTLSTAGTRIGQGVTPSIQGLVGSLTAATAALAASSTVGETFSGVLDSINLSAAALGSTLAVVGPPLVAIAGAFGSIVNAVGVPTLLAALAVYKLFPAVLAATSAAFITATRSVSTFLFVTAGSSAVFKLQAALALLGRSFSLVQIAIAGAAAGLLFLITRESAAERITRQLTEATNGLVRAQDALRSAQTQRRDTKLGVNAAKLAVLEAQQATAAARGALANTTAARGSFARTKIELELKVALDNVTAAQNRYGDALQASEDAQIVATELARQAKAAQVEQIRTIRNLVAAEQARLLLRAGRTNSGEAAARAEAEATREVTDEIRDQAKIAREAATPQSIALARRLELIANVSDALKRLPSRKSIEIAVKTDDAATAIRKFAAEFDLTEKQLRQALIDALSGEETSAKLRTAILNLFHRLEPPLKDLATEIGIEGGLALGQGLAGGLKQATPNVEAALDNVVARARGRLQGLEREALDISIAGGGDAQVIANLQAQEALARQVLAAAKKRLAAGEKAASSVRDAQERLNNIITQRRSLQERLAGDAKSAARDAKQKQEDIDNDLLEALGIKRDTGQERITNAQASEGLRDDIRRTRDLRQLVIRQIGLVRDQIKTASIRIDAIRQLRVISRQLAREIRNLQRQRQEEIQSRISEANQLDIELAVMNENTAAEIRARNREITRLRKLQNQTKQGTLEYKRLRNAIAEQQKAIEEARKKSKERNDEFRRLTFEFLQRQQGFATNLLGNLIPGGATSGLVGAVSPAGGSGPDFAPLLGTGRGPDGGRRPVELGVAAGAAAGGVAGPTRGQASTELQLLREIRDLLKSMDRGAAHPEAKTSRNMGHSMMDVV